MSTLLAAALLMVVAVLFAYASYVLGYLAAAVENLGRIVDGWRRPR